MSYCNNSANQKNRLQQQVDSVSSCRFNGQFQTYQQQPQLNVIENSINQNAPYGPKPFYQLGVNSGQCYPAYYPYILGYQGLSDTGGQLQGVEYGPSCAIQPGYYQLRPWYAVNGGAF